MKRLNFLWYLISVALIVSACSSSRSAVRPPAIKFAGTALAKSVEPEGDLGLPVQPGDSFSISDEKVVAHVRFENMAVDCRLRWDWYSPDGRLYTSSDEFAIDATEDKFRRTVTAWHALAVKGDKASSLPGKWSVKIFVNNDLVDTQTFMLLTTVDLALPEHVAQKSDPKKWALIIGIESYARLPEVEFARKDALIVKEYFRRVLGVPEDNITMLIDGEATKAGIESHLQHYLPNNIDKQTQLYVYFAGHGAPEIKKGAPFLVPYDGDTRYLQSTGYPLKKLYNDLDKIGNQRTYVFIDACFSGFASRAAEMLTKGTRPALLPVKAAQIKSDHIVSISSSSSDQASNAYSETKHGLFTYYLLKGLGGEADANQDGRVSVSEVYQYVLENVSRTARRIGLPQTPAITPSISKVKNLTIGRVPQ